MIRVYFERLALAVDRRSLRERIIIMVALGTLLTLGWYVLLIEPMDKQNAALDEGNAAIRTTVTSLEDSLELLVQENANDPNAETLDALQTLQADIRQLEERLSKVATDIIAPQDIPKVLGRVLQRSPGIALIDLRNDAPAPVDLGIAPASGSSMSRAFRHGVVMTVQGSYDDITEYVRAIENLEWTVQWNRVHLSRSSGIPDGLIEAQLELYTLSLNQEWMGV